MFKLSIPHLFISSTSLFENRFVRVEYVNDINSLCSSRYHPPCARIAPQHKRDTRREELSLNLCCVLYFGHDCRLAHVGKQSNLYESQTLSWLVFDKINSPNVRKPHLSLIFVLFFWRKKGRDWLSSIVDNDLAYLLPRNIPIFKFEYGGTAARDHQIHYH